MYFLPLQITNFQLLKTEIENRTNKLAPRKTISDHEIVLKIYSPFVFDLQVNFCLKIINISFVVTIKLNSELIQRQPESNFDLQIKRFPLPVRSFFNIFKNYFQTAGRLARLHYESIAGPTRAYSHGH